ncbi:hypothetical protein H2198_005773 [Neophaeococcomyces mojaviensis]|uniref:Uncharacterized protein n=1 Tax=Neophaeococcomyces mojaviensis TaxID=3383035 RepID=A0ACC3A5H3_9EURO|nr:hypothetical protein H2198_005773 [Knufia sp. JES_112]
MPNEQQQVNSEGSGLQGLVRPQLPVSNVNNVATMTSNPQTKTRILILSDTHSALPDSTRTATHPYSQTFPSADVAIHCGDLTSTGKLHEHERAFALLKSLPAPIKLVIPGNHDLTLDRTYCTTHSRLYAWSRAHTAEDLQAAENLYTSPEARDAGILYLVEGTLSLTLSNGAELNVYASAYTPEFCDWGFAYPRDRDRFNSLSDANEQQPAVPANPVPTFVPSSPTNTHILITHGPPLGILDLTTRNEPVGCEHLLHAVTRCKPLLHCFGHIHEAWGYQVCKHDNDSLQPSEKKQGINLSNEVIDKVSECAYIDATAVEHGKETVFVNASIMSVRYSPCQRPWIVDLMLPLPAT